MVQKNSWRNNVNKSVRKEPSGSTGVITSFGIFVRLHGMICAAFPKNLMIFRNLWICLIAFVRVPVRVCEYRGDFRLRINERCTLLMCALPSLLTWLIMQFVNSEIKLTSVKSQRPSDSAAGFVAVRHTSVTGAQGWLTVRLYSTLLFQFL